MIKISKVFEPFCEDKKNKCNVEQNYLGRQCYDKNIVIDELYEESLYKNCPQYAIDYIKEITNELKIIEVKLTLFTSRILIFQNLDL